MRLGCLGWVLDTGRSGGLGLGMVIEVLFCNGMFIDIVWVGLGLSSYIVGIRSVEEVLKEIRLIMEWVFV